MKLAYGQMLFSRHRSAWHLPKVNGSVEMVQLHDPRNEDASKHQRFPRQVSQWRKEIQEQAKTLFGSKRGPQPVAAHSEPDRLYGEIGRLKMELDWLKKKSGISLS